MMAGFKAGLRREVSLQEYRRELTRRRVNTAIAHARWAGRRFANVVKFAGTDRTNVMSAWSDMRGMASGILIKRYRVEPLLVDYAIQVAWAKLPRRSTPHSSAGRPA